MSSKTLDTSGNLYSGLDSCLPMDEGVGTPEDIATARTPSITGCTWVTHDGRPGLQIDGGAGDSFTLPDSNDWGVDGDSFTMAALLRLEENGSAWFNAMSHGWWPGKRLNFAGWSGDFNWGVRSTSNTYSGTDYRNTSDWVLVVGTYDHANLEARLMVRNVSNGAFNGTTFAVADNTTINSGNAVEIGGDASTIITLGGFYYWRKRVLTPTEVDALGNDFDVLYEAGGGGDQSIAVTETASASETVSLTAASTVQDEVNGLDNVLLQATVSINDTVAAADLVSIAVVTIVQDEGAATDSLLISVAIPVSDSAFGDEIPSVQALLSVSDIAQANDVVSLILDIIKTVNDSGTALDDISSLAQLVVQETARSTDIPVINVSLNMADTATGIDSLRLIEEKMVRIAEAAQALDRVSVNVQLKLTETAMAEEVAAIMNTLNIIDNIYGTDSVSSLNLNEIVYIADITFTFMQRRIDIALRQSSINIGMSQRAYFGMNFSQRTVTKRLTQRTISMKLTGKK